MNNITRIFNSDIEFKSSNNDMSVEGYALKFNKRTLIGSKEYGFYEEIDRDALKNTEMNDVILNFNHDDNAILSRTTNGSLRLFIDDIGLKIKAKIVDTSIGKDVYKLIKSKLINKMSFATIIDESQWIEKDNEVPIRIIKSMQRLFDVSAVTFPAYDDTEILSLRMKGDNSIIEKISKKELNNESIIKKQLEEIKKIEKENEI